MASLAHVNVAVLRFPIDDPRLAGFRAVVERVNGLADVAPGFRWRYPEAHRDLHQPPGETAAVTVVNLSVWSDYASLHHFVYRGVHGQLVRRRGEWFDATGGPTTALWWVRDDDRPTPGEALARLTLLRRHGPTPRAFTVRRRFRPDGGPEHRDTATGPGRRPAARRSPH